VKDLERDTASRLTFLAGQNDYPVWTPDGKTVVFHSSNQAAPGLYAIRSDGSGEAKRLTEGRDFPTSFSPDGKRLAIQQPGKDRRSDIFTLPVEADTGPGAAGVRVGKAELSLGAPFSEAQAAISPDGRWLAYQSDESGTPHVYVRPFSKAVAGPGGKWQVSTEYATHPRWSRDGRELLYQTTAGRLMATGYTAQGDAFVAGKPRVWAEVRVRSLGFEAGYDIAPDGKRLAAFLVDDTDGGKLATSLTFLLNFGDELRRKAPGK